MSFESYRDTFKQNHSELSNNQNEGVAADRNIAAPGPVSKTEKYRHRASTYESQKKQASSAPESVEATNLLIDQALEKTAGVESELDRALNEAKEDVYKRASLFIETDELPFWHFADLENAINTLSIWKEYIPLERYEACAEKLRIHAAAATRIMRHYSELWAPNHESLRSTKEKLFTMLANLRYIDPDDFPAELINITDDEFKELGSGGMMLRDGENELRTLIACERLARFDPTRFRRLFASEWSANRVEDARQFWAQWDIDHPTGMPKGAPAWENIDRALQGTHLD